MNTMTTAKLDTIEFEAAGAPPSMLDVLRKRIRASMADASQEVQEHAAALLLKLEHLARAQQTASAAPAPIETYLAPWLTLQTDLLAAA